MGGTVRSVWTDASGLAKLTLYSSKLPMLGQKMENMRVSLTVILLLVSVLVSSQDNTTNKVTYTARQTATLPCTFTDLGTAQVMWLKDSNVLSQGTYVWTADIRVTVDQPSDTQWNLIIEDLTLDDAGVYECKTSERTPRVHPVELVVQAYPVFVGGMETVAGADGADVTLTCEVTGYPRPRVLWITPEGRRVDKQSKRQPKYTMGTKEVSNSMTTMVLKVQSLEAMDYGIYKCDATNDLGTARRYVRLTKGRMAL